MLTNAQLEAMSDEEIANINKMIWKRAIKRTAIVTTVIVAVNVAAHLLEKHYA